jgi:apolipoprotein D and lipocalin family protein
METALRYCGKSGGRAEVWLRRLATLCLAIIAVACTSLPEGIAPVTGFTVDKYLGRWFEIARLDHSFERGLSRVSAEYSRRDDGGIRVLNRGYDADKQRWKEAEGKAYFIGEPSVARLKVSFFGPFYGGYNVVYLDPAYSIAMIIGPSRDYFWLLARETQVKEEVLRALLDKATSLGIKVDDLIWVKH